MNKKGKAVFIILFVVLAILFGLVVFRNRFGGIRQIRGIGQVGKDRVEEVLEGLSLEQKVGQVVLTGLEKEIVTEIEKEMIREASVSGFILLSKNIQSPEQVKSLTSEIKAIATTSATRELPVLISVDQEGGSVTRINFGGFETTPQWQIKSESQAFEVGKKRGLEIKSLGIDVNFSPVVEVLRNPNSYLGQTGRYFAGGEEKVAQLSEAMVKGMAEAGVLAVVKHFPGGLGRTPLNPHNVLPEIDIEKEDLEQDLFAFRRLIRIRQIREIGHIGGIMITHLLYPRVDKENPAAISEVFIEEILRGELGFEGVVVIDDLNMGAVVKNFDPAEYGLRAIEAGADLLIVIDKGMAIEVKERLRQAVEEGKLSERRLDEAVRRVLKMKFLISLPAGDLP